MSASPFSVLSFQHHAHAVELAAQGRCELRDRAFHVAQLPEGGVERFDDVRGDPFDRVLRDAHLRTDDLVDRKVVDRLPHIVVRGRAAQFGRQLQIDREAVPDLPFEVVAAVESSELHAFQYDAVFHAIRPL